MTLNCLSFDRLLMLQALWVSGISLIWAIILILVRYNAKHEA